MRLSDFILVICFKLVKHNSGNHIPRLDSSLSEYHTTIGRGGSPPSKEGSNWSPLGIFHGCLFRAVFGEIDLDELVSQRWAV
jgi:hypothetical protein